MSPADGDFIAGLVQAEAHFSIAEQNGGQSISCRFALVLRDDDTGLVAALHDLTGLGSIKPLPARGNSAPQVGWYVGRRGECLELARMLERHRLYGRKALEFAVWSDAVRAWQRGPAARGAMRAAAREIRDLRNFVEADPAVDITPAPVSNLVHYLGGFTTGDGHFSLSRGRPSFTLKQRQDEAPLLRAICRTTGLGNVYDTRRDAANSSAAWTVSGTHVCHRLARLLDGTIRGKKAAEFDVWADALRAMSTAPRGTRRMIAMRADRELKSLRQYRRPIGRLRRPPIPRVMKTDILDALLAFASEHDGPLDSLTYSRIRKERHPEWPTRNTVAAHLGGWHAALEAAGLADRAARAPERYANRSRVTIDARLAQQRERVLASVRRYATELGRTPRAMEYFRWRRAHEPGTPTQATVYKLFPGGWQVVLEALAQLEHELDVDAVADDRAA